MSLYKSMLKSTLKSGLEQCKLDLSSVAISLFFPQGKAMRRIFRDIQETIIERSSEFEDINEFREIGGYYVIIGKGKNLSLENVIVTKGDKIHSYIGPGGMPRFYADPNLPLSKDLDIDWEDVNYLVGYHTHPFHYAPSDGDLSVFRRNRFDIPEETNYIAGIYCKNNPPKFLWMQISRKL